MSKKDFKNIEDSKVRELYLKMWDNNPVVINSNIEKTAAKINKVTKEVVSTSYNSFSFAGEDKAQTLIDVFGIKKENQELFKKKFDMACGGSGQEYRRITTLHSSSLCALLFFYNVTRANPLTIDGIGTFTESVFEFRSPVIDPKYPSCMDVVLIGKNTDGKKLVLFLESKFSEYYTSASGKLYGISKAYLDNEYSRPFYDSAFLSEIGTKKSDIVDGKFSLSSDEDYYVGGIKQMISHYVGVMNNLNKNYSEQKMAEQDGIIKALEVGAEVVLAEILFDYTIGNFTLKCGKKCFDSYSEKYEILSAAMNEKIKESEFADRFSVLEKDLAYSLFMNSTFALDEEVGKFYFGCDYRKSRVL